MTASTLDTRNDAAPQDTPSTRRERRIDARRRRHRGATESGTATAPPDGAARPPGTGASPAPAGPSHGVAAEDLVLVPPDAVAPAQAPPGDAAFVPAMPAARPATVRRTGFSVAPDGSYAVCLADAGPGAWYPERWTLGGPVAYTVALPGNQPEDGDAQVLPLPDGRVLIRRGSAGRHDIALLYPTGPRTGEVPVGFVHGESLRLLPPLATGSAYALSYADGVSTVWLVHGGQGLERLARIEGRCGGGVWLDRAGRLLAVDRESRGRVKSVAVDLATGEVSPLLQIAPDSDDRLVAADPDSGLLMVRSDASGAERLGWGVLGSGHPVRFPVCLRDDPGPDGARTLPVAVRPGAAGSPESCAVLLRRGGRAALWRPGARRTASLPTPRGWLPGAAWWSGHDTLRMAYADAVDVEPCGVRDVPSREYLPEVRPVAPASTGLTNRQLTLPSVPLRRALGPGGVRAADRADRGGDRNVAQPGVAVTELAAPRGPLGRVLPLQEAPLAANA